MDKEVKPIRLEDGRKAERHVIQNDNEVTTELYAEEARPMKLESRVIEKSKVITCERRIQKIGPDGNILEEIVESNEPVPLQVREHIGLIDNHSLGLDKYATKDDMANAIVAAVQAMKDNNIFEPVSPPLMNWNQPMVAQSLKDEIAQKLSGSAKTATSMWTFLAYGLIAANLAFTVYVLMS